MATDNAEFLREQQRAVEQMRRMQHQSALPTPPFVRLPEEEKPAPPPPKRRNNLPNFDLLDRLKSDPDMALIGGLLLLLWNEKADRRLMMALLYILL